MEYGRSDIKYSENIRQFSIALSFYSPSAYKYVRSVFQNHLPELHTIQTWLNSINGSPGITSEALTTLVAKAKEHESRGKPLLISMMSDEMYIRKNVGWNATNKEFTGFVTCHDNVNNEKDKELPVAKQALVFMAVGDGFKLTVGYFFLSGFNAQGRAALTQLAIERVNNAGARVGWLS